MRLTQVWLAASAPSQPELCQTFLRRFCWNSTGPQFGSSDQKEESSISGVSSVCWGLFLYIGVGGRYILFYCIFHIYNQQFYFSNWKNNLCPRKRWKDYILFCVCEGICFIRVCVFHRVLDRIDAYNIFLNKKKKISLCYRWESRNSEKRSALSRSDSWYVAKDSNPVVPFAS